MLYLAALVQPSLWAWLVVSGHYADKRTNRIVKEIRRQKSS
jgi:hypothetical protein